MKYFKLFRGLFSEGKRRQNYVPNSILRTIEFDNSGRK